jgi:hypothetical protein
MLFFRFARNASFRFEAKKCKKCKNMIHRKTKARMFCAVNCFLIALSDLSQIGHFSVAIFPVQPFLISATAGHLFHVFQPLLLTVLLLPHLLNAQPLASLYCSLFSN